MRRVFAFVVLFAACATERFDTRALRPVADDVLPYAERMLREMELPGCWIAVLDVDPQSGEQRLWAHALAADAAETAPDPLATHRVASISKLYTATAAMVLVERGLLDLDAEVSRYVPEFTPHNPFDTAVTLRHLLGHRAGVVRESPVGHYFDPSEPSLEATVASLAQTALVFEPGSEFKYSNPAFGVVGEVVARVTGMPFEAAVEDLVLDPLELHDSDFAARADLVARQAHGVMWTYDGREIPTPEFRLGYTPAAELRATVVGLVRFARSWFPDAVQRVLSREIQESMWRLPADEPRGCGLGFFVGEFDGHRRVTHNGAVYGFASTLTALPDAGLAVAVVCTKDFANDVAEAIAERALRSALANRRGEVLAAAEFPLPLGRDEARALAGRYRCGDDMVELQERHGELYYDPNIGLRTRLRRARDGALVAFDPLAVGGARRLVRLENGNLHDGWVEYLRDETVPAAASAELLPYLGEYGWDHNVLIVYEHMGCLAVLIEWVVRDLLEPVEPDVYRFPPGMYGGDLLRFERDADGEVVAAVVGGARFPRRPGPTAGSFRMTPQRPIDELIAEAKQAAPPASLLAGEREHDLVDLATMPGGDGLQFDLRYATTDNFLGHRVYDRAVARLQRPAAAALLRVHARLAAQGVGIRVFDAYRPWWVTKVFWDAAPRRLKHFVADPLRGSRHNRGCAVDVTLFELDTGRAIEMPSGYDEFTERAYPDYPGGTMRQRHFRELLRRAMEAEGFEVYEHEWWHFDFDEWRAYGIANQPL